MNSRLHIVMLILIGGFLASCEKKIAESFLVYERTEISIPAVGEIKSISFPTMQVGYAITDKGTFKTINGGKSWTNLGTYSNGDISFFDEDYGVISTGFVTKDGGETWNYLGNSESVSINQDGQTVLLRKDSRNTGSLWISGYKDINLENKHSIVYEMSNVDRIECHGEHVYIFPIDFLSQGLVAYDYTEGSWFQITEQYTYEELITDICVFFK